MPWLETSSVEQRERFIADERRGFYTRTELCARYGISRKTGYKWLDRFDEDGRRGLQDRSHAPQHCPHRIASEIADLLCTARHRHPDWGPGKLLDWLAPRHPEIADDTWPAVSTAGDLLAREGLVKKRRRLWRSPSPAIRITPVNPSWRFSAIFLLINRRLASKRILRLPFTGTWGKILPSFRRKSLENQYLRP